MPKLRKSLKKQIMQDSYRIWDAESSKMTYGGVIIEDGKITSYANAKTFLAAIRDWKDVIWMKDIGLTDIDKKDIYHRDYVLIHGYLADIPRKEHPALGLVRYNKGYAKYDVAILNSKDINLMQNQGFLYSIIDPFYAYEVIGNELEGITKQSMTKKYDKFLPSKPLP